MNHYAQARRTGEWGGSRCSEEGCDRATYGLGLCEKHYQRLRYRELAEQKRSTARFCSVDGCDRRYSAKDLCGMHYERMRVSGEVGSPSPIDRAPNGSGTVIGGYRRFKRGGRTISEHREVMQRMLGRELTADETVHHINGDGLDNRPENLQLRQGRHGKGVILTCAACGSHDIEAAPIADRPIAD